MPISELKQIIENILVVVKSSFSPTDIPKLWPLSPSSILNKPKWLVWPLSLGFFPESHCWCCSPADQLFTLNVSSSGIEVALVCVAAAPQTLEIKMKVLTNGIYDMSYDIYDIYIWHIYMTYLMTYIWHIWHIWHICHMWAGKGGKEVESECREDGSWSQVILDSRNLEQHSFIIIIHIIVSFIIII